MGFRALRVGARRNRLNCGDFPSREAAQRELKENPSDRNNLDDENDGQACDDFDYGASGAGGGAADHQYGRAELIDKTIPDKGTLADTSGPP